eukprot:scaffold2212_cov107-Skeletonema_dohrnii-CCMP3373.AAC.2
MVLESRACGVPDGLIRTLATLWRRRCIQSMLEPCERLLYTIMANYNGSLEAVDCDIHSVRYDMVLESRAGGRRRCLIKSPVTLWRRRCIQSMLEPCERLLYTIMANYNGSLEAVDCDIHSVRYDMAVNRGAGGHLRCFIMSPTTL